MKCREGFVSNSSSSSFIINKENLSDRQIYKIKNHIAYARMKQWDCGYTNETERWDIDETKYTIEGHTIMDNFDMDTFLENIFNEVEVEVEWDY